MSNRVIPAGSINPNATIAPGVVIIESLNPGAVAGIPTNVVGAVGVASWGPVDAPVSVSTPAEYATNFGVVLPQKYDLGTFVNTAYLQGTVGNYACVRVTDGTDTASSAAINDIATPAIPGVILTAIYTGATGNTLQATVIAGSKANTYTVTVGRPGYVAENFENIDASQGAVQFWENVADAINNGQSGLRGPSQLVTASLSTGIGATTITNPGSGYTSAPAVSFTGGGTGATATAVIGFPIDTVSVTAPGSYSALPTLSVTGLGSGADLTPVMDAVSGTVAVAGSGYAPADTITLAGGTHTSQAIVNVATTKLASLSTNAPGTGYAPQDIITLAGGTFTTPASLEVITTELVSAAINARGSGYAPSDTVTLSGGTPFTPAIVSVTNTRLVSAAINAAGSNYAPSDTITLAGGTFSTAAVVTVLTVDGGGAILTFSISNPGIYTANTSSFTQGSTSGVGTGATFNTALFGINTFSITTPGVYLANSATFTQAGTSGSGTGATFNTGLFGVNGTSIINRGSYTANTSSFTQAGTSGSGTGATFNTALYGVNTVTINTAGSYTALPANPVSQASTSGSGTGATLNMFWGLLSVTVVSGGTGYTPSSVFTVTGSGSGAAGTLNLSSSDGILAKINITASGAGYSNPSVILSGGGGSGAAATAVVGSQNLPATPADPYTFSGGTNGTAGVTGTTLLGVDGVSPTGMYALRNQNVSLFALVDCDTPATYSAQDQFAAVTASQAILVGPAGQTVTQAATAKQTAGLIDNSVVFLIGDWCFWFDAANKQTRMVSPQGFYGGLMANLSPEQSPLNKPMFGILYTQKTQMKQNYSDADYVKMMQTGLEVISNPIPAGYTFGCETGKSGGVDLTTNNVCIQRMANFLALSFSRSGVLGAYIGQLQTPTVQASARAALSTFLTNLQAAQQIEDFRVILDGTNNPNSRVVLGFMEAQVTVQLFSVIIVFLINLNVGTVTIQ